MKITNREIQDAFQVNEAEAALALYHLANVDCEGKTMQDLNDLLGGFGVEPIRNPEDSDDIVAEYINTGDTYNTTILRDIETGEFLLTTWGDWLEEYENKVCAEQHKIRCGHCGSFTPNDRYDWRDVRCESCGRNVSTGEACLPRKPHGFARIKLLHGYLERSLFYRSPGISYDRALKAIELLANLVHDYEAESGNEDIWSIGECSSADICDLLSGSYWFFVHYSGSQKSDEYRIQCALSQVYDPGPCETGPERDSSAMDTYKGWKRRAKSARK